MIIKDAAHKYCGRLLWRRFFPPQVDRDDLEQEYRTAELEGKSGSYRVNVILKRLDNENRRTIRARMIEVFGCHDPSISDKEADDYQQLEREIHDTYVAERMALVNSAINQLLASVA